MLFGKSSIIDSLNVIHITTPFKRLCFSVCYFVWLSLFRITPRVSNETIFMILLFGVGPGKRKNSIRDAHTPQPAEIVFNTEI